MVLGSSHFLLISFEGNVPRGNPQKCHPICTCSRLETLNRSFHWFSIFFKDLLRITVLDNYHPMISFTGIGAKTGELGLRDQTARRCQARVRLRPGPRAARYQGRRLHPGALRQGAEGRLDRHQHEEGLEAHLRVRVITPKMQDETKVIVHSKGESHEKNIDDVFCGRLHICDNFRLCQHR